MDQRAQRLARGEPQAFAELYDACADRVHQYLAMRLGSRADADDVLQETFVCLARTRSRLAKVENLEAYVFATARNEAIRWVERQARHGRHTAALFRESMFREAPRADHQAIETVEWIVTSLARLSEDLREIIELKIYGNLTFREISELTGLPQGTVATRYRSALEKMRLQLVEDGQ